jgi:lysophospholipase L1-like esterase
VTLGDSNTAGFIPGAASDGWPNYLSLISQGRFQLLNNAGVGGNTFAQARARIPADVVPYAPNGCTVMVGTNDIITGVSIATWQTNVRGIVGDLRAAGIAPVLCTLVPVSNSQKAGAVAEVQKWNA